MSEKFLYNPSHKSVYTQQLELITKILLRDIHAGQFELVPTPAAHFQLNYMLFGQTFNISQLFTQIDYQHIHLDQADGEHYLNFVTQTAENKPEIRVPIEKNYHIGNHTLKFMDNVYRALEPADFTANDPNGKYAELSFADKCAINIYSGDSFGIGNGFLRGNIELLEISVKSVGLNPAVGEVLFNEVMLASALNKIPSEPETVVLYRGENSVPESIYENRLAVMQTDNPITFEPYFISTSSNVEMANHFGGKALIVFEGAQGKDITPFSLYKGEDERILLPSKILWKEVIHTNDFDLFLAQPVNTETIERGEKKEEICKLKFLSEYLQQQDLHAVAGLTEHNYALIKEHSTSCEAYLAQPHLTEMGLTSLLPMSTTDII